ncbi:579_t:CDS:2, partial [Acaulospora morrowiae]
GEAVSRGEKEESENIMPFIVLHGVNIRAITQHSGILLCTRIQKLEMFVFAISGTWTNVENNSLTYILKTLYFEVSNSQKMESTKIREAVKFLAEGDKATEKGWFKKPEWDVAGQNYEKAASCFKAARSYDQAIQAYQKASDALFKSDSIYMAAKTMESAANLAAQQLKQPERAAEMYRKSSDLYLAHMTPDRAAEMLEKGA